MKQEIYVIINEHNLFWDGCNFSSEICDARLYTCEEEADHDICLFEMNDGIHTCKPCLAEITVNLEVKSSHDQAMNKIEELERRYANSCKHREKLKQMLDEVIDDYENCKKRTVEKIKNWVNSHCTIYYKDNNVSVDIAQINDFLDSLVRDQTIWQSMEQIHAELPFKAVNNGNK